MKYLLFIALGGAAGAVSRYLASTWVHQVWQGAFPLGTLLVNLLGSGLIGIAYVMIERQLLHPDWRAVLMVGFLGAFTTFSTFSLESITLIENGRPMLALTYMAGSAGLCVLAAGATIYLARLWQ